MTRETKIGLLVGLAFIIVIGILLSDHLTTSTEPPAAQLTQAGGNVLQGVSTPGVANPPVTVVSPTPVTPQQPVSLPGDLTPKPSPVQLVQVTGPAQSQITVGPAASVAQPGVTTPPLSNASVPMPEATGPISQVASQYGEEIVDPNHQPAQPAAPLANAPKEYKAEPGDNLSKMAIKLLGSNSKTNRDALIRANASLQQDPNKIIAGRTYTVPTVSTIPQTASGQPSGLMIAPPTTPQTPSASPEYWYTVKEGDSLWKIAAEQLGAGSAVAAIKELNKETLNGTDTVRPAMKLRLPAKPLASAN